MRRFSAYNTGRSPKAGTGESWRHEMFETIEWTSAGAVRLLDQRRLPAEEVYVECRDAAAVAHAIRTMQIRGAPAIGVAGAMGLALAAQSIGASSFEEFYAELSRQGELLRRTRPTAVNLAWGIERMQRCAEQQKFLPISELVRAYHDPPGPVRAALDLPRRTQTEAAAPAFVGGGDRARILGEHAACREVGPVHVHEQFRRGCLR